MAPSLATIDDLAALLPGGLPASELARAAAELDQVSSLVRSEGGRTWVDTVPDAIRAVTLEVAKRVHLNPENMRQTATGPFSGSYALVGVYLTPTEQLIVSRAATARRGLFTLATTRGEDALGTTYVPTGPPPSGYDFPLFASDDPLLQ